MLSDQHRFFRKKNAIQVVQTLSLLDAQDQA